MTECPNKEKDQKPKGKKVLHATVESDDKGDDCLSVFCFMVIEEEREEHFERAFDVESMCMAKKNKELREQLEPIKNDEKALEEIVKYKEMELKHSIAREEELEDQLATK